jgi:hypothetical protein
MPRCCEVPLLSLAEVFRIIVFKQSSYTSMIETFLLQCQAQVAASNWFLDKLLPAFIGSATALLVFFLTSRRDRNKERRKKDDERTDKINYLKNLLTNVIKLTTQQKENLHDYIEKVKANNVDFQLMTYVPLTDFVRAIDALSKEDYLYFVTTILLNIR